MILSPKEEYVLFNHAVNPIPPGTLSSSVMAKLSSLRIRSGRITLGISLVYDLCLPCSIRDFGFPASR